MRLIHETVRYVFRNTTFLTAYVGVEQETTAREVVMLALREFGLSDPSSSYSLCEVSVQDQGFVKTKRLPDQMTGLPDKISLNARYN